MGYRYALSDIAAAMAGDGRQLVRGPDFIREVCTATVYDFNSAEARSALRKPLAATVGTTLRGRRPSTCILDSREVAMGTVERVRVRALLSVCIASALAGTAVWARQPGAGSTAEVTRTGCIVDERAFTVATGLGEAREQNGVHLVLMNGDDAATAPQQSLVLTGVRESDLLDHLHLQIEVRGVLEGTAPSAPTTDRGPEARASGTPPIPPTGAAGITPRGGVAHEPGDAEVPITATDAAVALPATDPQVPGAISDLPRLNIVSFRTVGGSCGEFVRRASIDLERRVPGATSAGAPDDAEPPAPVGTAGAAVPSGRMVISGCLLQERMLTVAPDSGGQQRSPETLLLTQASIDDPTGNPAARAAVPGSLPSGTGTGTVPVRESPIRPTENTALGRELAFVVEGREELITLVGQRVSITGTVVATAPATERPSAHSSTTPVGTLRVESYRPTGGSCRQ